MQTTLTAAIVGAGNIARVCHVPALRDHSERVELAAVVDVDAEATKAFAAEHGIPGAYTDLDQMLAEVRPDLVVLATPPHLHAAQAVVCLKAGAWVWCEKPVALSLAEYDAIAAAEGDQGPYAAVVYQQRFGSGAAHLRELLGGGALGRPLAGQCVTAWYRGADYFEVPWRGRWDTEGGGPTMGHGVHQMDLMLSILGNWTEVTAMAGRLERDVQTEDVSMAVVRFDSGALVSVVNSLLSPREESYLRFDFSGGTVELRHLYGYQNADWTFTPAPGADDVWQPPVDLPSSHTTQLDELLNDMQAGRRPVTSGAGGRQSLELITGMYKSALTGRPVTRAELGPDDSFYQHLHGGDPEVFRR